MVSFLFLIWTFCSIFLTLNVFTPLAKQSESSLYKILFSFFFGWLVGDVLPQWILLNLGILIIFSFYDIFFTPLGFGGIICHVLCWAILSVRLWIMLNIPERLEKKMLERFGNQWRDISTRSITPKNIFEIDWYSWFNPCRSIKDPRIEILRDQVYYEKNGQQLKLDIYRPKKMEKNRPGILQIHGGAWITGSKRQTSFFLVRMALQGWVCYSVTHGFSPKNVFPEHLIDIKRALRWIKDRADDDGLDQNFIISKGGSSGGHLASMMALTQNCSEFQPGFEKTDTSIQGCVSLYGVFNFIDAFDKKNPYPAKSKILKILCDGTPNKKPDCYKKITPSNWINKKTPPFLLVQGESDTLISVEETEKFWKELQSKNVTSSAFLNLPLVQHGFDIFPTLTAQCIVPIIEKYILMIKNKHLKILEKNETH